MSKRYYAEVRSMEPLPEEDAKIPDHAIIKLLDATRWATLIPQLILPSLM